MTSHNQLLSIIILGLLSISLLTVSTEQQKVSNPGKELALQYCSTCHQFPNPNILTKRSWDYLLTDMGFRLGIIDYSHISAIHPFALQQMALRERILEEAGTIPDQALLTIDQWNAIREYYLENAPNKPIPQPKKAKVAHKLEQFNLRVPDFQPRGAMFTLTRIDHQTGGLLLANQRDHTLTVLGSDLKTTGKHQVNEILVDVEPDGETLYFLSIGDLMGRYVGIGKGILHNKQQQLNFYQSDHFITGLHRPVDIELSDLDLDGSQEMIISNFGDVTGNISIYDADGKLIRILIEAPGAIRSQVHDFNHDGKPDIAALMGDARENISLFINRGQWQFDRKIVVETHPAYGHTYFELQDFNLDGHFDFLVVNGDTDADPFNTLKNYHGIRIYLNDGLDNFNLGYFYPMYGAHFAKAADFDGDGDLDIAASAFFPDFASNRPEQFVYLENTGTLNFKPYTHPETFNGRWMTLDIGDYDLDGDPDIVLGGGYIPLGMQVDHFEKYQSIVENGKAVLVFENLLVK